MTDFRGITCLAVTDSTCRGVSSMSERQTQIDLKSGV